MLSMMQPVFEAVVALKIELGVFVLAAAAHFLLFSDRWSSQKANRKGKLIKEAEGNETPSRKNEPNSLVAELSASLRSLQRSGAKQKAFTAEMKSILASKQVSDEARDAALAQALENLGRRGVEIEILLAVRAVLGSMAPGARLAEQLLRGFMALRARSEFETLMTELESSCHASGAQLPHSIAVLALQSCVGAKDLAAALECLPDLTAWQKQCKARDQQVMQQLSRLAAEQDSVPALLEMLVNCGLCVPSVLEALFLDAAAREDWALLQDLKTLAEKRSIVLTAASRCAELLSMAASSCSDKELLQYYESNLAEVDVLTTMTKAARPVAEAALHLKRKDVLVKLMQDCEDSRKVGLLKVFGAEGRLQDVKQLFEACPVKSACLHNALIDATVGAGSAEELEIALSEAQQAGIADVVTYNTIIKNHLQKGDTKSARDVLRKMRSDGLMPNVVTFNELLDASVANKADWALVDEMRSCGVMPNKVTCSILLKSLGPSSRTLDVERTMALLAEMGDEMDEVLLSSTCEACIRTGRSDLLAPSLRRWRSGKSVSVKGAHTFGSLIRAYGYIKDLDGVWAVWHQMKAGNVLPTSITLGCMVEALVTNDEIEAGYDLIQAMVGSSQTKQLVNAVMYGSILKGFCRQRKFDRVWTIYQEMRASNMEFSIVTYNSLIDACARSGEMHRVQPLLEDIAKQGLAPNVITYSTVIKGYCSASRLTEAFELLEDMKKTSNLRPDEVTYNTLLDGCARYGLYDKGMAVLDDMRAAGVPPSNFTLSVLVKLAIRSKQFAKAFKLCDAISEEHNLHLNVHVYNNLIQGCCSNNDLQRAVETMECMFSKKVRPDPRTYTLVLRGFCQAGSRRSEEVGPLLRSAAGLPGGHSRLQAFGNVPALRDGARALKDDILKEVLDFLLARTPKDVFIQLIKELRLEQTLGQRYASKAMALQ